MANKIMKYGPKLKIPSWQSWNKYFDQFGFNSNYQKWTMSCHLKHQEFDIQGILSFSFSNNIVSIINLGGTSKKFQETY